MLTDITQDFKDGKYNKLSFRNRKVFGRRVFIQFILELDKVYLGHLQYIFDIDSENIVIYIDFNYHQGSKKAIYDTANVIIKKYKYNKDMDLELYMKKIRQEIIDHEPQTKGFKWSFSQDKIKL